ncbi:MAG: replication initiator protein [Microviridae sp.]|nr:MAG: replication initiator protein [Microviridae sp.]
MKCSKPVALETGPVPCGQCMSCRVNKSRKWAGKLILESHSQGDKFNYFVTLTYDEGNLPAGGTLDKEHGKLFRQALRDQLGPVRFFWVGEYGSQLSRPHYHAMLFGIDWSVDILAVLQKCWKRGFVSADHFNTTRAGYIAQYCTKKITGPKADSHYGSRLPEFSQMSRRPALGDHAVDTVLAPFYRTKAGQVFLERNGDVVAGFRHEGAIYPLTNRHTRRLRVFAGLPETLADLRLLNPEAIPPTELPDVGELAGRRQREVQIETRTKIFRQKTHTI